MIRGFPVMNVALLKQQHGSQNLTNESLEAIKSMKPTKFAVSRLEVVNN